METFLTDFGHAVRTDEKKTMLSMYDLLRGIGIANGHKQHVQRYAAGEEGYVSILLTKVWSPETKTFATHKSGRATPCITLDKAKRFIAHFTPKSKLPAEDLEAMLDKLQISNQLILDAKKKVVDEKNIVKLLRKALPFEAVPQFAIGPFYRIDLYLPKHKIAIECDEFRHEAYDRRKDETRERFISDQLGCRWVRFDPYSPEYCPFLVIRRILRLVCSP